MLPRGEATIIRFERMATPPPPVGHPGNPWAPYAPHYMPPWAPPPPHQQQWAPPPAPFPMGYAPQPGFALPPAMPAAPAATAPPAAPPAAAAAGRDATARISKDQAEEAIAFIRAKYETWSGVFPSNHRTARDIVEECTKIGISSAQLKHQFNRYEMQITGRGVGKRDELQRQRYEKAVVDVIGDGEKIMDDAFSRNSDLLDARPSFRKEFMDLKDNASTRKLCLELLRSWAYESSVAWAAGSGNDAALAFYVAREKRMRRFRRALVDEVGALWLDPTVAVVLEGLLYEAYRAELKPRKAPPLEMPTTSTTFSTAQKESLYYIAGFLVSKVMKTFVDRSGESISAWAEDFTNRMNLGEAEASQQKMPLGKVKHKDMGSLCYAARPIYDYVCKLETIYLHNMSTDHFDAYGSGLLRRIGVVIAQDPKIYEAFASEVLPLLRPDNQDAFPMVVYKTMLDAYDKVRRKDTALSLNRAHEEHRRLDATAGKAPLRTALAVTSANAASSRRSKGA